MVNGGKRLRERSRQLSEAEIDAQIPSARAREAAAYRAGLRATAAHYDVTTERVVLELSNGVAFAFPAKHVRGLATASPAQRAALVLSPSGSGIIWDHLNADMSVPGLLAATFRRSGVARVLGGIGGAAKSDAKTKAARANGKKGGRRVSAAPRSQDVGLESPPHLASSTNLG